MNASDSADHPDVNVWFTLSYGNHPQHARAKRYWEDESSSGIILTWHTMLGLARLLTNSAAMSGNPLEVKAAWVAVERWLSEPGVKLVHEPSKCLDSLESYIAGGNLHHRGLADAYLAAFSLAGNYRMVSFDAGFKKYPGLDFLHLKD